MSEERYMVQFTGMIDGIEQIFIFKDFEQFISFYTTHMGETMIVYRETAEPDTWVYIGTI